MRVLVTGGCGFIGSAVVRLAVDRGDQVLNLDRRRKITPAPALQPVAGRPGYARLETDISDRALMRAIFREFKPDAVIHLAACPDEDPSRLFESDIGGAFAILEACRAHFEQLTGEARQRFRIVQALRADSDTSLTPAEAARATGAAFAEHWSRAHALPLVTCLAGNVFGPWQADTAFLPSLISSLLAGRSVLLENAGETVRDWLPVRDFAAGLIRAAEVASPLTRFDFSVGAERRDIDLADTICVMLDTRLPAPDGAFWSGLVNIAGDTIPSTGPMLDISEAERDLGWKPQGFHTGLDRLLTWAMSRYAQGQVQARSQPRAVAAE